MALDLSGLADDLQYVDGAETLYVTSKWPTGNVTLTVRYAVGEDVEVRETSADGGYFQFPARKWTLSTSQFPDTQSQPKAGDTVQQADGTTWEILDVTRDALGWAWECVSRKDRS